jgi:uncharacterized membrane protein YhaH (DUF805 family)
VAGLDGSTVSMHVVNEVDLEALLTLNQLWHLFFEFHCRIGRKQYLLGLLAIIVTMVALFELFGRSGIQPPVLKTAAIFVLIVLFAPWLAISVKRLHDRDRSGWWIVPFYFVPKWLDQFSDKTEEGTTLWWAAIAVAVILGIWGFIEMVCLPGTSGQNRYDEKPAEIPARW